MHATIPFPIGEGTLLGLMSADLEWYEALPNLRCDQTFVIR
jgi:hypothetical protein